MFYPKKTSKKKPLQRNDFDIAKDQYKCFKD